MFVFDNSEDLDIATYEYRLYTEAQVEPDIANPGYYKLIGGASINSGTVTPYSQGFNTANVFTVAVENSTTTSTTSTTSPISYYGAIRSVDTSANVGPWTLITKTSTDTPLIDEEFIGSLTAAKITAGTIGAHDIILGGGNSIIKSSTYDDDYAHGAASPTSGWYIGGDGHFSLGGPHGITYDNATVVIGSGVQVQANLAADSISVGGATKLNINSNINAGSGGMTLGDPTYNYWYSNGQFSVGGSGKYLKWDGSNITTTGTLITNATVSGGTVGGINAGTDRIYIRSDGGVGSYNNANTQFYVDSSGRFSLKNKLYWDGSNLTIDGTVTIGGAVASTVVAGAASGSTAVQSGNVKDHIGGTNVTTITGGKISTGTISSVGGTRTINLDTGDINFGNFTVDSSGNVYLAGTISASSGNIGSYSISGGSLTASTSGWFDDGYVRLDAGGSIVSHYHYNFMVDFYTDIKLNDTNNEGCLSVQGTASGSYKQTRVTSSGVIGPSDARLKNILDSSSLDGLNILNNLSVKKYAWKSDPNQKEEIGLIAQELNLIFPEAVYEGGDDENIKPWGVDYAKLVPVLIKSVQELSAKVDELESRLV